MNWNLFTLSALLTVMAETATAGMLTITFDGNNKLDGNDPSPATGSQFVATFVDNADGTSVTLTMSATLAPLEFVSAVGFNFIGPAGVDAADLLFSSYVPNSDPYFEAVRPPQELTDIKFNGPFDFGFQFQTSNSDPLRFQDGNSVEIVISVLNTPIDVSMFNAVKGENSNKPSFLAGLHLQGVGTNGNQSVKLVGSGVELDTTPVPEPTSVALLALGSIGLGGFRLRRKLRTA